MITIHPAGVIIALTIVGLICSTLYWMLHPPQAQADIAAQAAEQASKRWSVASWSYSRKRFTPST
jgi:hypothetical protein